MSYEIGIGGPQQQIGPLKASEAAAPAQPKELKEGSGAHAASVAGQDQASFSTIGGLVGQALASSDVRSEKVAALQQAIAAGQYNVSSTEVAAKLLQSMLEKP
ncbi:MAG: flagellar biosynthesis anti-sigma factor FlgM [Acidobacteriota bacterium]|nr:flagellar biosynthesis anti-sigma factor FlgM [Acidobacteriota bacterium]